MNKQQASDRMGYQSIAVSDTNNYQFPSWLIQPHILFHIFVPIISNRNNKLMKINSLVGRKCARGLNIVIRSMRSFQNLTSVIHIDQQHFRLYSMNDKPYY
jgi:hypothetical protein